MTDHDILEHLKNDRYTKAVKGLYTAFPSVRKMILTNAGSKEDAEDIFQEALLILYKKVKDGNFILSSALSTYLNGIARNLWYMQLRKKNKENLTFDFNDVAEVFVTEEENQYQLAEMAFNLLGEKCKQLLLLFYFRKKSMQEVAGALGFSNERVAKNQKYRCIEKAKDHYAQLLF
jgi:RNA polymerase sigma factor (sigma-70 family)